MLAVQYDRYGGPEVVEVREVAPPVAGPGQILVRVEAAALNPKDVLTRAGKFASLAGRHFPKGLGYDYAGAVAALGPGVAGVRVGDPVFGMLSGWRGCALAQSVAVGADEWAPRPAGLRATEAAALPLVAQTALQALRDLGRVGPGSSVAIHGASGGVGTVAVQIAKALGARVTALCGAGSFELVRSLGADAVHDYRQTPPSVLPEHFDCFFDAFGNQSYWRLRPRLKARGTYVTTVPSVANLCDHALTQVWPGRTARLVVVRTRRADLEQIARWVEAGALRPVIAQVLPLAQVRAAQDAQQSRHTHGKIVLTIP
ncbi:NAD(P)-dependent alcohol dehydrogenase [Fontimonas sp. SYSU GA230001]|uniref:NAD(P)-dependent alcohol dehydrogenase n=1 Tax=Fontimonas sp. SYSU GA230001 TaxID=3142450 RepID=UPI0032B3BC27